MRLCDVFTSPRIITLLKRKRTNLDLCRTLWQFPGTVNLILSTEIYHLIKVFMILVYPVNIIGLREG